MIRKGLWLSLPPLALIAAFAAWGWLSVPAGAEIAVHFDATGAVNRYGSRLEAFGLIPALAVGLIGLFTVLPMIDPRGGNVRRSGPAVLVSWIGVLWVLAVAQGALTLIALGGVTDTVLITRGIGAACALLLIVIGNVLGKARPNWFVGIRTPWTLSSDRAWDVTHRWGGRLLMLSGLASLPVLLLAPAPWGLSVLGLSVGASAITALALSFWVWRTDPARETYNAADPD